jgi:hypothetical protein
MDTTRFHALEARHAQLDRLIHNEEIRPRPDSEALAQLKKQKLKLKEEMLLH